MWIGGKIRIEKKVPNLLVALFGIKRFVLRITHPAKLFVRNVRFRAVTLANELDDSSARIDLAADHAAHVALFSVENILPVRFVTEKLKCVRHKLTRAVQFLAYRGNEDDWAARHIEPRLTKIWPRDSFSSPVCHHLL